VLACGDNKSGQTVGGAGTRYFEWQIKDLKIK